MLRVALCYKCTAIAEAKRHHLSAQILKTKQKDLLTIVTEAFKDPTSEDFQKNKERIDKLGKEILDINDKQEGIIEKYFIAWKGATDIYQKFDSTSENEEWDKIKLFSLSWRDIISHINQHMQKLGIKITEE